MKHKVSVIGLGVMGQRMLGSMARYDGFTATAAWDPDEAACQRTAALYPDIVIAPDAGTAIAAATEVVYIACPPAWHEAHARAAMQAGKAIFCEKPLGVDVAASTRLVDEVEAAGVVNIVNLSLASAVATGEVEARVASGALGEIAGVDVRIHFSQWPRAWQMDAAGWLSYRAEGGFTREVLSHWIYLTERLLGPANITHAAVLLPDAAGDLAETHVLAGLEADRVPVTIAGTVGGAGPDRVEFTLWGTRASLRINDWNRLLSSDGGEWVPQLTDVPDPREAGYERQLANAAAAVAGEFHTMPGFRDALSVQRLVEAILAA